MTDPTSKHTELPGPFTELAAEVEKEESEMTAKEDKDMAARLKRLDDLEARLKEREDNLIKREEAQARGRSPATTPKIFQAEPDVRAIVLRARAYLAGHHYQPGNREMQLVEAIAHAFKGDE